NGWDVQSITTSASGAQPMPPSISPGASVDLAIAAEGVTAVTFFARDIVGNVENAKVTNIRIDKTAPVISFSGNLSTYTIDQDVAITCSAADALSGIAATSCPSASGPAYLLPLGNNSLTASATDKAGNTTSLTISFRAVVTPDSLANLTIRF